MALVTAGLMNKQIAGEIGVSEITVKVHRGNVMRKMGAKSLADLVRMADVLGMPGRKPSSAIPKYNFTRRPSIADLRHVRVDGAVRLESPYELVS